MVQHGHHNVDLPHISYNYSMLKELPRLASLFRLRESRLLVELSSKIQSKIAQGKDIFEVWMLQESDLIQAVARAYAERVVLDQLVLVYSACHNSLKPVLHSMFRLYALVQIEKDIGWFLGEKVLYVEARNEVGNDIRDLCQELAPQACHLVDAFAIPKSAKPPIALDWEKYNITDNKGELIGEKY